MNLRGERSMGYIIPVQSLLNWVGVDVPLLNSAFEKMDWIDQNFDTIKGKLLVEKYEAPRKASNNTSTSKQPKLNRLVDGQINLHVKTKNLRHVPENIKPNDTISITYKTHGTSWWVGNVLVKRKLSFIERFLKKLGVNVLELDYDIVYGSRNVVKNKAFGDPKGQDHFYGHDLWADIKNSIGELIPKGFTLYGELVGFTRTGEYIQKGFDYGCDPFGRNAKPVNKLEVYRITQTNPDGVVTELSYPEIKEFCDSVGLNAPKLFFYGKAGDWYNTDYGTLLTSWSTKFVKKLEEVYNEKDCFMCENKVPEEGIVIRKEKLIGCESYKLKSFRFLEMETKQLDKGESNVESEN